MATYRELLKGTQRVHPKALEWSPDGNNSPLMQLDIQPFKGVNNVIIRSKQKHSGRWGKDTHRAVTKDGIYSQVVRFSMKDSKRLAGKDKPSLSRDRCLVSCQCSNYYYMWWHANKKSKSHDGANFKAYSRKTTDRPEVNPSDIPGVCKHLVYLMQFLRKKRKVQ